LLSFSASAAVAELVYAHGSGPCGRKPLGVRVPPAALSSSPMYERAIVAEALRLHADGDVSASQIALRLGLDRSTVSGWLRGQVPRTAGKNLCARCGGPVHRRDLLDGNYVYLLGLYLGDGCLSEHARDVYRLRIVLDEKYPGIIDSALNAVSAVHLGRVAAVHRRDHSPARPTWPGWTPSSAPSADYSQPCSSASLTASLRLRASSFCMTEERWLRTVPGDR
jgi:DNA-binding transcriptional ArsR family regulator